MLTFVGNFITGMLWVFIIFILIIAVDMLFRLQGPKTWEDKQIERITGGHHGKEHFHK